MEEINQKICIICRKPLDMCSGIYLENSGMVRFDYSLMSKHYGKTFTGHICDECTDELHSKSIITKLK